jgi:hypothetical protein
MRYYLDTEFNGFGGALLSLALVPEDGGEELYLTLDFTPPLHGWVERHVVPYLDTVPVSLQGPRLNRADAAKAVAFYLQRDQQAEIIADWPEDIAQFCNLLMTGPGLMVRVPALTFRLMPLPGFSTAANSVVPHNALHDARSLRDHLKDILD